MNKNNRMLYGVISIILAALVAFIAIPSISSKTTGKVEIIRVTKDISKGAVIDDGSIELVEVGGYNLPDSVAKNKDDVVGKYAKTDILSGDYILSGKVSFTPVSSDTQLSELPSGKTAISLSVKSLAAGLSNKLQPGDIVRIYYYNEKVFDIPELQFVQVLSISDSTGADIDNTKTFAEDEEKQASASITVLANPIQAQLITRLENEGTMHVALITRGNQELAENLLQKQDQALIDAVNQ